MLADCSKKVGPPCTVSRGEGRRGERHPDAAGPGGRPEGSRLGPSPGGVVKTCPSCGEENPDRFRLCGFCGTPLPEAAELSRNRSPQDGLHRLLRPRRLHDPGGASRHRIAPRGALLYFNEMRAVLERHGGTVEKYIGDAIMAVFGLPQPPRGRRPASGARGRGHARRAYRPERRIEARWGVRLTYRTGVNTGEVVARATSTPGSSWWPATP